MSDLTDFLIARIAEREAVAQAAVKEAEWEHGDTWGDYVANAGQYGSPNSDFAAHADWPRVVLAECEAKRRIVGMCSPSGEDEDGAPFYVGGYGEAYVEALAYLALPYADHPDYRDDFAP